jgi:hypothetical protein
LGECFGYILAKFKKEKHLVTLFCQFFPFCEWLIEKSGMTRKAEEKEAEVQCSKDFLV